MTVVLTCPYCNFSKKIPKEKIPGGARRAICPKCHQQFEFSRAEKTAESFAGETGFQYDPGESTQDIRDKLPEQNSPWEKRSELGLWKGILYTIKSSLFSPQAFFSKLKFRGGIKEPLAFAILMGSTGYMLSFFWQFLIASGGFLPIISSYFSQFAMGLIILFGMIVIPFFVVIGLFISSSVWHLLLLIVRGANNGFEATFKVVAYSQSTQIFSIVPFAGSLIGSIWRIIIQIIGLREIHKTSYLKVIVAFLIPVAFFIFLLVTFLILFFVFLR